MPQNIFVLCDTRLSLSDETAFRKLWGGKSFSIHTLAIREGSLSLSKMALPLMTSSVNILKGNFSKLSFKVKN